jgi:Heterokaryon incompatibility protein (HET)
MDLDLPILPDSSSHGHELCSNVLYGELPREADGIIHTRLLALLPGSKDGLVQCRIVPVRLGDAIDVPIYQALSYCWGDPEDTEMISCDDVMVPVTRSLEAALRNLRLRDRPRMLWADAVCINQRNVSERSHQVSIMALIYKYAAQVVVWLGEASPTSESAFWLLHRLADADENFAGAPGPFGLYGLPELGEFLGTDISLLARYRRGPLKALQDHLLRPWFTRLWVIQEVTSARDVLLICGEHKICWLKFCNALRFASLCGIVDSTSRGRAMLCLSPFVSKLGPAPQAGILYLLQKYRHTLCSDDRDKIFAFFGMTRLQHMAQLQAEFSSIGIVPDYDMSVQKLYEKLAYKLIYMEQSLDVLSTVRMSKSNVPGLPSWVPDWTQSTTETSILDRRNGVESIRFYSTAKDTLTFPKLVEETLTLSGYVYDTVLQIADVFKAPVRDTREFSTEFKESRTLSRIFSWIWRYTKEWVHAAMVTAQGDEIAFAEADLTKEALHDVYWQTLTCINTSDVRDHLEGQDATIGQEEIRRMYDKWYESHRCCRFSFRLGLSKPWMLLPLFCVVMDLVLFRLFPESRRRQSALFFQLFRGVGRRIARTSKGHLALVAPETRVGDAIGLFRGGKTPLILRPKGAEGWELVGDAYVHGIMKGEAWDDAKCEEMDFV